MPTADIATVRLLPVTSACPHVLQRTYTVSPCSNDETCRKLLSLLVPFQIGFIIGGGWGSYAREVPGGIPLTGKIFTQRI
ncbi:hypothetical protein B6E78_15370 [Edwardsiella ictaluri]|nr:hypothetical protein B6E78_15370 [Edwardsiella ictaluri]